jgi:fructan beta-fructosidase
MSNKIIQTSIFYFFVLIFWNCQNKTNSSVVTDVEAHRPGFHFTPDSMWMNDPNGMVFYEGEYHLFYQYYPDSTVWGPMHWGHAVSKDMIAWEHLPIALFPDSLGFIFSGSAVIDWKNTSGFGQNGQPPMIAIFTHHNMAGEKAGRNDFQYQSIAYSNDKGRTWTKFKGNPVIPNTQKIKDFRDPKVIWDEDSKQWVMVFAAQDEVMLWGSHDLKNWTHLSNFGKEYGAHGGVWECPDLFQIKVEETGETMWVLLLSLNPGGPNGGSGTQYFVGNFDGENFKLDPSFAPDVTAGKAVWLDWGRDNYAGVTWSDIPKEDGRRLFIGWMSNWDYAQVVPTTNWRSAMTIPRTLQLENTAAGYRILSKPIKELESFLATTYSFEYEINNKEMDLTDNLSCSPSKMDILLELELPENKDTEFSIALSNNRGEEFIVGFDSRKNEYFSDRTKAGSNQFSDKFAVKRHSAPRTSTDKIVRLHLIFDVASCELFADNGLVAMTEIFFPTENFSRLKLSEKGGGIKVKNAQIRCVK